MEKEHDKVERPISRFSNNGHKRKDEQQNAEENEKEQNKCDVVIQEASAALEGEVTQTKSLM